MFDLLFSNLLEKSLEHNVPFSVLVLVFGKMGEDPDEVFFVFTPRTGAGGWAADAGSVE